MLERCARAAQAASIDQPFTWENAVRAVLTTLLEPDEGMVRAGTKIEIADDDGGAIIPFDTEVRNIIKAAISAVITEGGDK